MNQEMLLSPYISRRIHGCVLRCERLEDRLAFSISGVQSWWGLGGMIDLAPVEPTPIVDEIPEAVDIGIVEEPEASQQPGDEVPPLGVDSGWEDEDQWFTEDDQIVWYMPWFGDEEDGAGNTLCDDTGIIVDVLPLMVEEGEDTYEVPNFPLVHPNGSLKEVVPPTLELPRLELLSSFPDEVMEVPNFSIRRAGDLGTTIIPEVDPSLSSSQIITMNVLPIKVPEVSSLVPVAPQSWIALAPESNNIQFYTLPTIQFPEDPEDREPLFVTETA